MSLEANLSSIKQQLYVRRVPEQYDRLIAEGTKDTSFADWNFTRYSVSLYRDLLKLNTTGITEEEFHVAGRKYIKDKNLNPLGEFVKQKFKDSIVVDLASGPHSHLLKFAMAFGAKLYIGVDIPIGDFYHRHREGLESVFLEDDMLHFAASLPDEQINCFYINGVEGWHLFDWRKYESALINEIYRALKKDGMLLFGDNPDNYYLGRCAMVSGFREIKFPLGEVGISHLVFVKPGFEGSK